MGQGGVMSIDKDRRELYPQMNENEVAAIDESYLVLRRVLMDHNLHVMGDDRAENLIGAIARFVEDCKP